MKKWIGVTRVRNECDIIEMFVRQNLSVLDELHIIVNNCTDPTTEILSELKNEGLPLIPYTDRWLDNRQEIVLTNVLHTAINPSECEWCFFLDADEFITIPRETLARELEGVPTATTAEWTYKTYVPLVDINDDDISFSQSTTPFHMINFRRDPEPPVWRPKIIIPSALLHSITISPGSHAAMVNGKLLKSHRITSKLIHIPIRSTEQLKSKFSIGELSLKLKASRSKAEGTHWRNAYSSIKSGSSPSTAISALYFDDDKKTSDNVKLVYEPINWAQSATIKFGQYRKTNAFVNLLNFAELIAARLGKCEIANGILETKACKHGLFAYYTNDMVIGKSLELYGEWGEHELECLSAYIREGNVAIDVGANIGTHAVYFSKLVGKHGVVHAFEPQRRTFHLLNMNAALNACGNMITHQEAISDRVGTIGVPNIDYNQMKNIGNVSLLADGEDTVKMVTIDDLRLEKVDLIKVDVEGMELDVILGAEKTIKISQPVLFIKNNIEERSFHLLQALFNHGYHLYWHFASYFNEANYFGNAFNFLKSTGRPEINILALPARIDNITINLEPITSPRDTWKEGYERACQNARSYVTPLSPPGG